MIYVLLANGFEEIEALAFIDIIRRADIPIAAVSIYDNLTVTGSHNISVVSDMCISDIQNKDIDAIVLPGGMPGTLNLLESEKVKSLINYAFDNNKYLGAICAAPMIFGKMMLLNGKKATCYPGFEKELIGAEVLNDNVVKDGNIITSRGAGTAHNFAHCFISEFKSKEKADEVISSMQY